MNAPQLTGAEFAEVPDGQALALLENIGDLCAGRDQAIALWVQAYDTLHANMTAAGKASIGGNIGLGMPMRNQTNSEIVTRAFLDPRDREAFATIITQEVDRRCWDHLMKHLGFDQLLDRQAREEFQDSLRDAPPAFSPENCAATFGNIWETRRELYLRGIANVFMAMDRRFRSHDAFAIGNRLIIPNALSEYGSWQDYNRRDTLRDVERIFLELDGKPPADDSISGRVDLRERDRPARIIDPYFKVDVFKNGNIHLWFTRKDLLAQVNALLLEYYKPVEGDVSTDGPSYEPGPLFHATPAKHFGAFNSSPEVAAKVIDLAEIGEGMSVLEPSAGTGVLAKAARRAGGNLTCIEVQPGLAHELSALHGFADIYARDFLACNPASWPAFDRIVMNPPFDRGRDCDHVRHAYQFLRPGGRLVAIMASRAEFGTDARHQALHDIIAQANGRYSHRGHYWHDLPERSFAHAGTNVNTVMLVLQKPR